MDPDNPHTWSPGAAGAAPDATRRPVLRVRSLPDLLSLVPVVLGFEPRESLVVVALGGARPGFQLRADLPAPGCDHAAIGAQLVEAVRGQGCTRVAVLAFTGDVAAEGLLHGVSAVLGGAGVAVVDVVRAHGGRYWSLTCDDPRCCPPAGVAYDPLANRLRAEATLAGICVAPDRAALAARFAACTGAPAARMRACTAAAEQEAVALLGLRDRRDLTASPRGVAMSLGATHLDRLLDQVLGRPAGLLTDAEAAALSVWCAVIGLRDLAWTRMDPAGAPAQLAVWSAVARRVVAPYEPAVLSLAGFAAWLSGDGASAWCAVDRALAADPGYSMARLLADALVRCVPPDVWVPPPREVILAAAGGYSRAE